MFQSTTLEIKGIHKSHKMVFRPCLFLECENCLTTKEHGARDLAAPCRGM